MAVLQAACPAALPVAWLAAVAPVAVLVVAAEAAAVAARSAASVVRSPEWVALVALVAWVAPAEPAAAWKARIAIRAARAAGAVRMRPGDGSVGQYPGETAAERRERLEGELEESVGGFDEVLADEQKEISTVGRNTEGFGNGQGGAGTGRVGLGGQGGNSGGGGGGGGGGGNSAGSVAGPQEQREASVGGLSEEEIRQRTPDDIPNLVSEDIVARQLREAALAEDDPELRERLWEEYRTYNDLN